MTLPNEPKKKDDRGPAQCGPNAGSTKAGFDIRQWKQNSSVWISDTWQRIKGYLRIAFAFKRDGHDVPIAIAVFIAIVPFYLLWQQNTLAYRQEQISRVQTYANTLITDRQILIDIDHAYGARNKLSAMITAYKFMQDATVTVSFYKINPLKGAPEQFSFPISVKGFMPEPCEPSVPAILPSAGFEISACKSSDPVKNLKKQSGILFNTDDFGRVALSLVNYLKLVADTQQTTLTGAGASGVTLPQIIEQAIESCNLNPAMEELGEDPNRMQGLAITMASIEKAAQDLGQVYASEYFNPDFSNQGADQSKKTQLLGALERALGLLLIYNNGGPQAEGGLYNVERAIALRYVTLSAFVQKANNQCNKFVVGKLQDRHKLILEK